MSDLSDLSDFSYFSDLTFDTFPTMVTLNESYATTVQRHSFETRVLDSTVNTASFEARMGIERPRSRKSMVIAAGVCTILAGYLVVSAIVRATSEKQVTEKRRVTPFTETSLGTYDKDIDEHLKLIISTISLQLRKLCNTEGADMSWESLQAILAQCPVLEADKDRVYGEETFNGEFSETAVSTWLYDFINRHDSDVLDAARIHSSEINEVIKFVGDQSVGFTLFSKDVSNSYDLIDIGMIRFPTKKEPFVKLYRLHLKGIFEGRGMLIITEETRLIAASVRSQKYYPRDELLQRMLPESVKNTLEKFESVSE